MEREIGVDCSVS